MNIAILIKVFRKNISGTKHQKGNGSCLDAPLRDSHGKFSRSQLNQGLAATLASSQLTCKATFSCGCRRAEALKEKYKTGGGVLPWTKPKGIAARNSLLSGYKYKAALSRNL